MYNFFCTALQIQAITFLVSILLLTIGRTNVSKTESVLIKFSYSYKLTIFNIPHRQTISH
jgi:uncharacterized membrane protein YiaA